MPLPKSDNSKSNETASDKVDPPADDKSNETASDKVDDKTKPEAYEGRETDDEGNPLGTSYIRFTNPETGESQRLTHEAYIELRDRKGW